MDKIFNKITNIIKYIKVKEYKERGEGLLGYMLNSYYIEKER